MPFDALVAEAETWAPGAEGLLFLPYLAGERTPHADPDARGAFVGLELRHDRGALVRAVLEGVAFGLRDSLDLLRALGVDATDGAGLGRRRAQPPLAADRRLGARPVPLELTESEEGSAFGAALLGGVAGGVFADVARSRRPLRPRPTGTVEPDPAWREAYGERTARYRALYPALAPFRP